jgi:hypothetical protein
MAMVKGIIATCVVFIVIGFAVFGMAWAGSGQTVSLPEPITAETPCPVVGCLQPDGACHAAAPAPEPDGTFLMTCPKISCSESSCHAWDRVAVSSKPSDASLNLWIIAPVALVLGLVILVKRVG